MAAQPFIDHHQGMTRQEGSTMQPERGTLRAATAETDGASAAGPDAEPRPPGLTRDQPTPAGEGTITTDRADGSPVMCAIDDDGLAPGVLATAAAIAERLDVALTVVHSPYPSIFLNGERYRRALERGNALVDRLTDGYRVDSRIVEIGEPGRLISNVAREGASMVVLGTRGRTGLRAAILGSVSQAVSAQAPCPVVTVSADGAPSDETPREHELQRAAA
jgi:nucleotide-binding universal stress UspA family protein